MNKLKEIRKKKKLTQIEAAEKIGVSIGTYKGWENGTWPVPELKLDAALKKLKGK